ncbi:hypothetical protein FD755_014623, partial [Muntiacus reevesi]
NIEKDIAVHIKKEFDKKYNPSWHHVVEVMCHMKPNTSSTST